VQAVLQGWFDRMRNESVARTTIKVSSQARNLVALARADVGFDTLPVDTLSSGSIARYEIRQPDADQLVRADLPSAMFTFGTRLRVEVLNGTGAIALTQEVARRVVPAGDEVTLTGNVPGFGVRHTQVVYYRTADLPAARRLAAALGVGSVALGNVPLDVVDLTVVVGKDFHPTRRWGASTDATYRALVAAAAADDKKGNDIVVLDVGDIISITDYFVIASGGNTRQVRTIVDSIEQRLREQADARPRAEEGREGGTWVLLDYGDIVVHVFLDETREYYSLERLWADAPRVDWESASAAL
jgi:ribosome-associated protein